MHVIQIPGVKRGVVVGILGQGNRSTSPSELWFFKVFKKSPECDPFIEGRWLYDVASDDENKIFKVRIQDDISRLPKACVIDSDVVHFIDSNDHYCIPKTTIRDLETIVDFENDIVVDKANLPIMPPDIGDFDKIRDSTLMMTAVNGATVWKQKVSIMCFS